ncbi:MAG TPA: ABC transporter permease [Bacteroidales bacterium]|nr:ABC transporter permease [Bacteroidales bacterium]
MKKIGYIIRKEFLQLRRSRMMLAMLIFMPFFQLLILVPAATMEMKEIKYFIIDNDLSSTSRGLCAHLEASPFYRLQGSSFNPQKAENELMRGNSDLIVWIPTGFENDLLKNQKATVQLQINAINGVAAGLIQNYTTNIIAAYNQELLLSLISFGEEHKTPPRKSIFIEFNHWYNPELRYPVYMLPGILVILVSIIGMYLSALNIVKEKEIGTIEQLNVTPVRRYQFIVGKLIPFWLIAMAELALGLMAGCLIFQVSVQGSLVVLFAFTAVYLLAVMGVGIFISTISSTQQQVMFVTFFFMLTFILMSGIFTPVENMPDWAQKVNVINPFAYFMRVIRMVMLKGSGFSDIRNEFIAMGVYAAAMLSISIWRYRKTTG